MHLPSFVVILLLCLLPLNAKFAFDDDLHEDDDGADDQQVGYYSMNHKIHSKSVRMIINFFRPEEQQTFFWYGVQIKNFHG